MTTIDWKALKPHVPLGPGDPQYVERAGSAGDEIAQWILAGSSPLLVGGPAGIGKSTELARAAELIKHERVACLVQLDRYENMRHLTPERMLFRISNRIGGLATEVLNLPLSAGLSSRLAEVKGALDGDWEPQFTATSMLGAVAAEVARLSRQGKVTILLDGLEKVPQSPGSLDLFDALADIREEVELVVVIPWHAAFGPQAQGVIRSGERFVAARALEVDGPDGKRGRDFLRELLVRRLKLDDPLGETESRLLEQAALWSGGVPRVFLQLMAGAGLYAARRSGEQWPREEDMADARADHVESIGRLFMPGDEAAIRSVVTTSGRELDLERKVRLLAQGILLERLRNGAHVLELHPLAKAALAVGGPRA